MAKNSVKVLVLFFCLASLNIACGHLVSNKALEREIPGKRLNKAIRIGYFRGGRTALFYRAFIDDYFKEEGVEVILKTKILHESKYLPAPKDINEIRNVKYFGKVTGEELIEEIVKGNIDGATVGESAFILMASKGLPIVAVAMLGHDVSGRPGHAVIFRKDIVIRDSSDIKGKVLATRRAGPADKIFLLEFLRNEGLEEKDVKLIEGLPEDRLKFRLENKSIDGAYYHLAMLRRPVEEGKAYIYRKLDWLKPELSHALLVFSRDFVKNNPQAVESIVKAYVKRIKFEHSLSNEERLRAGKHEAYSSQVRKILEMATDFQGMDFPQYDLPPLASLDLLSEMQMLLCRYKYIAKEVDLMSFIDNSFVEKAYKEAR